MRTRPICVPECQSWCVSRLRHAAAVRLLTHAAPDLVASVASAVAEAGDGNPLALQELAATLDPGQRSGQAELPVPLAPGLRLTALYQDASVAWLGTLGRLC